jgi:ribosomal protein S18 acetylase RimI-like enzyme
MVAETDIKISDIADKERAVKIFAEAFINDPMNILIFNDESTRYEMVEAIYRFVVFDVVPEMKYELKGLDVNGELAGVIVFTTTDSTKEWSEHLMKEGKKTGEKTGEKYVTMIREYYSKAIKNRPKATHFYINELAVRKEYQGRGYGKALLEYVENISDNNPLSKGVALDTSNSANLKFYEHFGYKLTKKFRFHGIKGYSMFKKNHRFK